MASAAVSDGRVRINGNRCDKPSTEVKLGDVLTFSSGSRARVIRVLTSGTRRGPASEAQLLYEDLTPPVEKTGPGELPFAMHEKGSGRPTKRDRRAITALKGRDADG